MNFTPLTETEERTLHRLLSENYQEVPADRIRCKNGEALPPEAVQIGELLYRQCYPWMVKKAERDYGVQRQDAEDYVGDTILKFLQRGGWQGFNENNGATVKGWFARVVKNGLTDADRESGRRKNKENATSLDQEIETMNFETEEKQTLANTIADAKAENPIDRLIRTEMGRKISAALESLPVRQREAFLLTKVDELTYAQAGKIMRGISPDTIKSHVQAAKKRLGKLLENYAAE